MKRSHPQSEYSKQEQLLMKRLTRTRKLFGFLRETRHELFDDAFQAELESMYRQSGAGKDPKPPALLAMVMINMRDRTITCPADKTERFTTGTVLEFNPKKCARCALRLLCTNAGKGSGRTADIAENEQL